MKPRSIAELDASEFNVIFVHSKLDDHELSAPEFRVYCHLARRAGTGVGFPGIDSMARVCKLSKHTIIDSIRSLEAKEMLIVERRPGLTTRYRLTAASQWLRAPAVQTSTSAIQVTDQCNPGNATSAIQVTKGYPIKDIQEGDPILRNRERKPRATKDPQDCRESELIYDAYPLKVGRPVALRAIDKALKKETFEHLLQRTSAFAHLWLTSKDKSFCPHPSTWFNQERYNDDVATWNKPNQAAALTARLPVVSDAIMSAYTSVLPPDEIAS